MSGTSGFWVRIFIPSGEPEGLRIVEKSNWTGQGLVFPRTQLAEARRRDELKRTGVYVLWGPGESGPLPRVYVGEGDAVLSRLDQHAKQKDFWTHAAVFTSKDQNLNKAHVKYLEARLVGLAAEAKRAELDNNTVPQLPVLSEADAADAEGFLADLLLCLPVVGVGLFEKAEAGGSKARDLHLRARGVEARGRSGAEGFVVRAGSQAVKAEVASIHGYLRELRRSLVAQGVLEDAGGVYRLTQDYIFNSPSTAAGVILGRSANGRIEWRDAKSRTLKEIEEAMQPLKTEEPARRGAPADGKKRMPRKVRPEYSLGQHRAKMGPGPLRLFEDLRNAILALGDDVTERVMKQYVGYRRLGNFCEIVGKRSKLDVFIDGPVVDSRGLGRDYSQIGHWGTGDLRVEVKDQTQLTGVLELIEQAYRLQG